MKQSRLQRYIQRKKKLGQKRVSFFVDEKVWKYFKKNAKNSGMSINEFLIYLLDFK